MSIIATSPGLLAHPIITSLLDSDFYKLTMGRVVMERFPAARARYRFVCRTPGMALGALALPLREQVNRMANLSFTYEELDWLGRIPYLGFDFADSLRNFRLAADDVQIHTHPSEDGDGDQLEVIVDGPWWRTILWEVPILAMISELYHLGSGDIAESASHALEDGERRLAAKIRMLEKFDKGNPLHFIEMGTRRRCSRKWQEHVVNELGTRGVGFLGTSNMDLARRLNLKVHGTMAHEYISAFQAIVHPADSQRAALDMWMDVYRGDLGTALTDTIGMDAFFRDFDRKLALSFSGARHDSGDPYVWARRLIAHYESLGIDPKSKTAVFSDNLDLDKARLLTDTFGRQIRVIHGIGTNLTNDLGRPRLSIVMKLVALNGRPVAKISDEPLKAICDDPVHLAYLKRAYKMEDA